MVLIHKTLAKITVYMVTADKGLNLFYPNMIHVMGLAHAEEIRANIQDVDKLIYNMKKNFIKDLLRFEAFKKSSPLMPRFPKPSLQVGDMA